MSINISGPDGSKFSFPDGTSQADITAALDQHFGGASGGNVSRETQPPGALEGDVRAAATGVPIIGGLANKLDAATNALLAPYVDPLLPDSFDKLPESSFGERYAHALKLQNEKDASFGKAHPVQQAAAELAGGMAGIGGAIKAAPEMAPKLLGLTGDTLPAQVINGAAGGAALSAADAATRGEDMGDAAQIGAITGGVAPMAGRLIGRGIEAVNGMRSPPPVPANLADIAGVPVRQSLGQATGDTEAIAREQMGLRGSAGPREAAVARDFFDAQKGELANARTAVASKMGPNGEVLAENPQDAASILLDSLGQRGQTAAAADNAAQQAVQGQRQALDSSLGAGGPQNPADAAAVVGQEIAQSRALERQSAAQAMEGTDRAVSAMHASLNPAGGALPLATSPLEMGQLVQGGVDAARMQAEEAKTAAYDALRNAPGRFHPAAFNTLGADVRGGLASRSADSVPINADTTPLANQVLDKFDEIVGPLAQQRDPATGRIMRGQQPLTAAAVDDARKRLNVYYGLAKQAGQAGGKWADASAMRDIIDEFDNQIGQRLGDGRFIGDASAASDAMTNARALNTQFRRTFTRQGAGDKVGPLMEQIVGQHEGQQAAPETVAKMLTSGPSAPLLARRLTQIFGRESPEIGAIKQGLFSSLVNDASGERLDPTKAATNIKRFLGSSSLADEYFSQPEKQMLGQLADRMLGTVETAPAAGDVVGRAIPRIVGENGQPMTAQELQDTIFGRGAVGDSPLGVKLAQHIAATHGPGSPAMNALRSGTFARLHGADAEETAGNINEFLNGRGRPMAETLFSPAERQQLKSYGDMHADLAKRSAPPEGQVDKVMARLSGRSGEPATTTDVVNFLNTTKGVSRPVGLVQRIKSEFGADSREFAALKQGQWAYLTEPRAATGALDIGSRTVVKNLRDFLEGPGKPLAHAMFTPDERELMKSYADLMERITPPNGTVNHSNTAATLGRMMRGSIDLLVGIGGLHMAGPIGMAAGFGAEHGQKVLQDAIRAAKVARLLYGTPRSAAANAELEQALGRISSFAARAGTASVATH